MRFVMLMILPKPDEANEPPYGPEVSGFKAMMIYNRELQNAGVLLSLDGFHAPAEGARVHFKGGAPRVADGPFADAHEVIGGYWIIDVASKKDAVNWARRCPGGDCVVEVRQIQEASEFPPEIAKLIEGEAPLGRSR